MTKYVHQQDSLYDPPLTRSSTNEDGNSAEERNNRERNEQRRENGTSDTTPERGTSDLNDNYNGVDNRSVGIFERLMDTVLGMNRGNSTSTSSVAGGTIPVISESSTNQGLQTLATTLDTTNGGAIVITVNYVFSDENNPQNPNRSGSLVMTLPNSSSNRDPRVIQEFIRLATQMAYSTIMQGLNKEKGITIEKFNSFPLNDIKGEELDSCSICFEKYEELNKKKRSISTSSSSDEEKEEINLQTLKKRKTESNQTVHPELSPSILTVPESATTTETTSTSEIPATEHGSTRTTTKREPKFLSEFKGTFSHVAVKMPCGHLFGKSCLFEWLKNHTTCPLCRCSVAEQTSQATTSESPAIGLNNLQYYTLGNIPESVTSGSSRVSSILNSLNRSERPSLRRVLRSGNNYGGLNVSSFPYPEDPINNPSSNTPSSNNPPSNTSSSEIPSNNNSSNNSSTSNGTSSDNSSSNRQSTIISHLLTYLSRSSQQNSDLLLFPSGVLSRRTESGVETRRSDDIENSDDVLDFMNLQSLVSDDPNNSNTNTHSSEQDQDNQSPDNNDSNDDVNST